MPVSTERILVVDIEATCWPKAPPPGEVSEIIEVGVAIVKPREGIVERGQSVYVRPVRSKVSAFCTELTGITQGLVNVEGVAFSDACLSLRQQDSERLGWASWGDYDRKQFIKQCREIKYPFSETHLNVKYLWALRHGKAQCSVMDALKHQGMPFDGRWHSGRDDAYNIGLILLDLLQ